MSQPGEPVNPLFPRLSRRGLLGSGGAVLTAPAVAAGMSFPRPASAFARAMPPPAPRPERPGLADYPYASRYAEVLGSRLHYLDEGEGPALVFLNDNPSWSYVWRHVPAYVRAEVRCIALDYPGTGLSDKPVATYNHWTHLNHLEAFVDALDLERVALVGHGWGTALATSWGPTATRTASPAWPGWRPCGSTSRGSMGAARASSGQTWMRATSTPGWPPSSFRPATRCGACWTRTRSSRCSCPGTPSGA